uniref:Translation initiation factor IF-2, chloroplastic n=1 Tax=Flintiella sanguinaria TaxID=101926 RepID=A0A1X9PUK4_9RHOD|nr:initiation factor IF2 [Flintiella sanguinaria]
MLLKKIKWEDKKSYSNRQNKKEILIRYLNISDYNTEGIIDLNNPKIFTFYNNNSVIEKPETQEVNSITENNVESEKNLSNSSVKYKQKTKENNRLEDLLENKKNKIKNKKKNRDEIDFDEEENNLIDSDSLMIKNIGLSLMRPPKPETKNLLTRQLNKHNNQLKKGNLQTNKKENILEKSNSSRQLVKLTGPIKILDFSEMLNISEREIIKLLFMKGIIATINQIIDLETAKTIADNLGIEIDIKSCDDIKEQNIQYEKIEIKDSDALEIRPPVVTIMGHVDHGKTTLLDTIRKTKIVENEAGGITQVIGAYEVQVNIRQKQEKIVFLDTPGHEAFRGMRLRGANLTDIAILIIAADDGIQPQTVEAIEHIKRVQSPYIVAINKIDRFEANVEKIKEQLTQYDILADSLGGDVQIIGISAIQGTNIDKLLETILILADLANLRANPLAKATGTVIETHLDKTKGPTATLLVQNGTLNLGDLVVSGISSGKVRALENSNGEKVNFAYPTSIVKMWGLSEMARSGDIFEVVNKEKEARILIEKNKGQKQLEHNLSNSRIIFNNSLNNNEKLEIKQINLIVKTDTPGSLEAILNCLSQIPQRKIQIKVVSTGSGEIKETDIDLANTTNSRIIGFNINLSSNAKILANRNKTSIKIFNIIYDVIAAVEEEMKNLLDVEYIEEELGKAKVKTTFPLTKGIVAGCYIETGKLEKSCLIKVLRQNEIIFEGKLDSLKRVKEDINEIDKGNECGVVINDFSSWNKEDEIIAYKLTAKSPSLL